MDGIVGRDTYQRQHALIEEEIFQVSQEMAKLKDDRTANIKVFEQFLFMSKDIYKSYQEADFELKKQYLRIFWERLELKDGRIEKAVPTKVFQALLNQNSFSLNSKVRISSNWLPVVAEVRTMAL